MGRQASNKLLDRLPRAFRDGHLSFSGFIGRLPAMVNSVKVWRRYEIVSTCGTRGTYLQQLLVFTTARRKAPEHALDLLLRHYHVDLRVLMKRDQAAWMHGSPSAPGG